MVHQQGRKTILLPVLPSSDAHPPFSFTLGTRRDTDLLLAILEREVMEQGRGARRQRMGPRLNARKEKKCRP